MSFLERINAVLHGETPDRVSFVPYAHLIPRGEFAREMRDRGMGLLVGCSAVWRTQPNVRVGNTSSISSERSLSDRLVIGMTEMGTYGVTDDESERVFKEGVRAIVDAIDEFSGV